MKKERHNLTTGSNPSAVQALKMSGAAPQDDRPRAQTPPTTATQPMWARYIDSRMKQFVLR